jgi:tetratricopeptide (TPR) repeat protein
MTVKSRNAVRALTAHDNTANPENMHKNAWLSGIVGLGVALSAWVAVRAEREERAQGLTARSLRLLRAPLSEAASYRDVRAREARELLEEASELSESSERVALLAEARTIELLGRGDDARAALLLSETGAIDPHLRVVAAGVALARGNARGAQSELDQLPQSVQDGALLERRALARELLGQQAEAVADLERAAELDRRSVSALLALGRLQRSAGRLEAAILAFNEASQRNPSEGEAWLGSGVCRAALGDLVSARVDLERAVANDRTRAEPLIALADIDVADKDVSSALRRYRAALQRNPHHALGHLKYGNALMRAGTVPDAVTEYRAAIAEQPELAAAHNGLGAALAARGELSDAETELRRAAELDPADAHPWLNLARIYQRRGDEAGHTTALQHARERDPQIALAAGR